MAYRTSACLAFVLAPQALCSCCCCCCALPCRPALRALPRAEWRQAARPASPASHRPPAPAPAAPGELVLLWTLQLRSLGSVPDPTLAPALTLSKPPSLLPPWNAASPATTHLCTALQHAHAAQRASSAPPPPSGEALVVLLLREACTRAVEQASPSPACSSRKQPAPVPWSAAPPSRAPEATSPTQRATGCASPGECASEPCPHPLLRQAGLAWHACASLCAC